MSDKCPFCGADWGTNIIDSGGYSHKVYHCGTAVYLHDASDADRTMICREIANLKERLVELENIHHQCCKSNYDLQERLDAWRLAGSYVESDIKAYANDVYEKLQDLGEL